MAPIEHRVDVSTLHPARSVVAAAAIGSGTAVASHAWIAFMNDETA
jgi:hypothetical protein